MTNSARVIERRPDGATRTHLFESASEAQRAIDLMVPAHKERVTIEVVEPE